MSRGFVREDDQEEVPLVPQRAYLPAGVANFVTPAGMDLLLSERKKLIAERDDIGQVNENERRITANHINARLQLLDERISTARVVNMKDQPSYEVRFGASVTLKHESNCTLQTIQIVGVDEANASKGKISFVSPFAKSLINKKSGDRIVLKRANGEEIMIITGISYT
jgi:transcription elongation factor GreB